MGKSTERVERAAQDLGLSAEIVTMPASTRTAEEAAQACGCEVAEIVKSLVFAGRESGKLVLCLVAGDRRLDPELAAAAVGEPLERADPKVVREETGFAIGGVAPIGHLAPIPTFLDETLLSHTRLFAAAGAPNAVFAIAPDDLLKATGAKVAALSR